MRLAQVALVSGVVAAVVLAGGCNKPLFPKDQPRSPYERYLAQRGRLAPQKELNAFGRDQPALRDRLKPLE